MSKWKGEDERRSETQKRPSPMVNSSRIKLWSLYGSSWRIGQEKVGKTDTPGGRNDGYWGTLSRPHLSGLVGQGGEGQRSSDLVSWLESLRNI